MRASMSAQHLGHKFIYFDFGGHRKKNGLCLLTFASGCTGCHMFVLLWCWFGCCSNHWRGNKTKTNHCRNASSTFWTAFVLGLLPFHCYFGNGVPLALTVNLQTLLHWIDEDTQKQLWGFSQPFKMNYLMWMYNNNPTTHKWMIISSQTFWCCYCILSARLLCFHTSPFFILSSLPAFLLPSFPSSTQNLFHPSIQ